eukprot:7381772-Prymnesium_polylepis.2
MNATRPGEKLKLPSAPHGFAGGEGAAGDATAAGYRVAGGAAAGYSYASAVPAYGVLAPS